MGNALFIPYFLIGVGMIINVQSFTQNPESLWPMVLLVITGMLTKWIASAVMAWQSGYDRNGMWLMFGLTNAHAAGALAIVMIGINPHVGLMTSSCSPHWLWLYS